MIGVLLILITTFASQTWLQALHSIRNNYNKNLLKGISLTGLLTTLISEILWIIYAAHNHLIGGVLNATLSLLSVLTISIILYKNNLLKLKTIITYSILSIILLLILNIVPVSIVAIAAMISATIFLVPQTVKTVRSIGTKHINGMSNYSIIMIIVANSIWILYGYYYSAYAYLISSIVLLSCGLIMGASKIIDYKKSH